FELPQSFGMPFAALLTLDLCGVRLVRSDNCALTLEVGLLKKLVELACLIDASGNQECVPSTAFQPVARFHVHQDIGNDFLQPVLAAENLLHRSPALLEFCLC